MALWITDNSLSFVSIIGLIALAGIEVKNTILLVDFTNQLRSKGMDLESAIREAGEVRFPPIVLIGGLISSTLLSNIVTPVVYKLVPPRVGWVFTLSFG